MRVGAAIVTHQDAELAHQCLNAVRVELAREAIVVVVNLPSEVDRMELDALRSLAGKLVENDRPAGYGANVNRAVSELGGSCDAYLVLNDDAFVERGAVGVLAAALEEHNDMGIVGPRVVDAAEHEQDSAFRFPAVRSELAGQIMLPQPLLDRARGFLAPDDDVDWLLGAAFLVRNEAWHAVGGFDERYVLWFEEIDLARRLRDAGWRAAYEPKATVRHVGAASVSTVSRDERDAVSGRSRALYIRTHWSAPQWSLLLALQPLVFVWNAVYAGARIVGDPRSFRAKAEQVERRWSQRLRVRDLLRSA